LCNIDSHVRSHRLHHSKKRTTESPKEKEKKRGKTSHGIWKQGTGKVKFFSSLLFHTLPG